MKLFNKLSSVTILLLLSLVMSVMPLVSASAANTGPIGPWSTTSSLPYEVVCATTVTGNGYIYHIGGGDDDGTFHNDVSYAQQNSDGSLGAWIAGTSLPNISCGSTSAIYNGYIYVLGGLASNLFSYTSTVYYAPLNSDGSVGAWLTTTNAPDSLYNANTVVSNGYIYVLAGYQLSAIVNSVYYAPLNPDGTLGAWLTTTSFPSNRGSATAVANNGYIYEIGGGDSGGVVDTVYYAPVNADGSIDAWLTGTPLPQVIADAASVVHDGFIYEIGGRNESDMLDTSYYASINPDGSIGTWITGTPLPVAMILATGVTSNGYLYQLGGRSPSVQIEIVPGFFVSGQLTTVYYAKTVGSTVVPTPNVVPTTVASVPAVKHNSVKQSFNSPAYAPDPVSVSLESVASTLAATAQTAVVSADSVKAPITTPDSHKVGNNFWGFLAIGLAAAVLIYVAFIKSKKDT